MDQFSLPTLAEAIFLLPMTVLTIFACIPITIKVFSKNQEPANLLTLGFSVVGILLAAVLTIYQGKAPPQTVFSGALIFDRMAIYVNLGVLAITLFTLFLSINNVNTKGNSFAEHTFLILLSAVGMLTLTSSGDLMVAFIGLEIMSCLLYTSPSPRD